MLKTGLQTVNMPMVGLGSWLSAPGEVEQSIEWALQAGVRMFDTAYMVNSRKRRILLSLTFLLVVSE